MKRALLGLGLAFLLASTLGASCGQTTLAIMPGIVNDPQNLSLRRSVLAFATDTMCDEMRSRSVPLVLHEGDPAIGRFYVLACHTQELVNKNLFVQFSGYGYAWTTLTKRVGFEASAAVELDLDFQLDDDDMYVYFRQRSTTAAEWKPLAVEQPVAGAVLGMPTQTGQTLAEVLGPQLLRKELSKGFTVIRDDNGRVSFSPGLLPKGKRPTVPFEQRGGERELLTNERIEVHEGQRDFAGPFEVLSEDDALYLTLLVEGAPGIDALVVPRGLGDQWAQAYVRETSPSPPPGVPVLDEPVPGGQLFQRMLRLAPGQYYVVLDHTTTAGRTAPPGRAFDDRSAHVSLAVERGSPP
jgi:hypothetical protein